MKYYKRKIIIAALFLFCAVIILFSGLLQLLLNNRGAAGFQIVVALLFAYDFCVYIRPYLALGDEKLLVSNGLLKQEVIFIKDIISIAEKDRRLIITYKQGHSIKKLRILLSQLKKYDKEQFVQELKSKQGNLDSSESAEQ